MTSVSSKQLTLGVDVVNQQIHWYSRVGHSYRCSRVNYSYAVASSRVVCFHALSSSKGDRKKGASKKGSKGAAAAGKSKASKKSPYAGKTKQFKKQNRARKK